ncbi:MAG TPA: prenyltransferase/squalene oxidase repeat-containing protein [Caulifigura sp.]|jgi:squalene-hopene/tetraprenyl-beta-curcumene cyclase|nr:prenyltransferase/squalene oxidase repeat-containing protein [Caulifigura sp.]
MRSARDWLLEHQHLEGFWIGELEGDTILESEYILLLTYLGRGQSELSKACANSIRSQQLPTGGWAMFPGGLLEISASVKAYWALKIVGDDPNAEHMVRAREAIRAAGGAEKVNSFTRFYFALLGTISYKQCPAVPPELMLLPTWMPLNIYEMSSWSRTIVVPLSILWAYQPSITLPPEHHFRELFLKSPEELPVVMPPSAQLDAMTKKARIDWAAIFRGVDRAWKGLERAKLMPLRKRCINIAKNWMLERFDSSDGLGAIFPPIVWSVVALKCLGYSEGSPEVQGQLRELEKLTIRDGDLAWLEPCRSPVWDTAISVISLRDAGVPADSPQIRQAVAWLLSKEIRQPGGDWSVRNKSVEPSGWAFEFNNRFYPDIDDTIMVVMALAKCLPEGEQVSWNLALSSPATVRSTEQHSVDGVILAGKTDDPRNILANLDHSQPILDAMRRGINWVLSMQSRNGGWGAFDADNTRELLTRVPFADHNAMIDPPTADITARTLEMFGRCGGSIALEPLAEALEFVWQTQESDGAWYGRWGVNYLYGTWQVLVGLEAIGISSRDRRVQHAVQWLKKTQQANGGWGETARSYDDPSLRGQGPATASQTAWAILGLIAAGEAGSLAVQRGIRYLSETQKADGTWDEEEFTGTGFPRVFYLRYHLYRHYFPLMALGRYARACHGTVATTQHDEDRAAA